ncbi:hypothetical protein BJV77DRAFT_1029726 [Russula vinacea]|nr:hypothetical protein BJV77DRAFT_1029726 [Russula vinacea]
MDRSSDSSRHHSVSLPGIRTLFPDHLLSTGGRNYHPQPTPTRPFNVCASIPLSPMSSQPSCEL